MHRPVKKSLRHHITRGIARIRLLFREDGGHISCVAHSPRSINFGESLVVISANLWHDWPRHRVLPERLEIFAATVEREGADLVLLQEVVRLPGMRADEWLADRLGMSSVFLRVNGHAGAIGFEEGLTILSKDPISESRALKLEPARVPLVKRMALAAKVSGDQGDFWAFSAHLAILNRPNIAQLAHLRSWITATSGSQMALIGGDFNADDKTSQIRQVSSDWVDLYRRQNPDKEGTTFALRTPLGVFRRRLDYLFLHRGEPHWQVEDAGHLEISTPDYSDHASVIARLRRASL